jgi:pimeloyl-ACP methyl ester carboxylesterase
VVAPPLNPATRRTGTVETSGERIYFEVTGDGEPVVLCHGLGGNHASWWQQLGPLVDAGFAAVTWDQRGFGNSTRRSGLAGPEPAVGDLAALVDHLGLDRVHLVGQSMGGWVTMGAALGFGDRVASLTLTDTLAGVFTDEVLAALSGTAEAQAQARPQLSVDQLGQHPALGPRFRAERPDLAVLYQVLAGFGDKPADDEMMAALGAMRVDPAAVSALAMPVHLLVGADDHLCPPDAMRGIAALIAGAELTVIDGSGHSPYFEDAHAFNQAVIDFIDRHRLNPTA